MPSIIDRARFNQCALTDIANPLCINAENYIIFC